MLRDTIRAAACIIGKGSVDKEEYPLYLRGIQALDSHVMDQRYSGEIAAHQASKYKKFSYMKKQKLESFGYLVEAVRLLEE